MRRLKKLLGVILLLSIMSLGGASAFADGTGVTEVPCLTTQTSTAAVGSGEGATVLPGLTAIVSLMTILPL